MVMFHSYVGLQEGKYRFDMLKRQRVPGYHCNMSSSSGLPNRQPGENHLVVTTIWDISAMHLLAGWHLENLRIVNMSRMMLICYVFVIYTAYQIIIIAYCHLYYYYDYNSECCSRRISSEPPKPLKNLEWLSTLSKLRVRRFHPLMPISLPTGSP